MAKTLSAAIRSNPPAAAALLIAAGGGATILGAYFFQYVLGLAPCPLCLQQRIPYYVTVPLSLSIAVGALHKAPRGVTVAGLTLVAVSLLIGAALGIYHAGIEWKWWAGPRDCSGPMTELGGDLLQQLQRVSPVRCDQAAWRFLGLSLAGYNVLISTTLAAIALYGIRAQKEG